jgi:hypothetical protein
MTMSLDLQKTVVQLDQSMGQLRSQRQEQAAALTAAQSHFRDADPRELEQKRQDGRYTWLVAGLGHELSVAYAPPVLSGDYAVVATDGSHIDVDRHAPARSSLINIGHVMLRYGELADAQLWSTPTLYTAEETLVLRDPDSGLHESPLTGQLLGMSRTIKEVAALADLVESVPADVPVLALLDGTLVLFGLAGQGYPDYVRTELLNNGLLPALDRLRALARQRTLVVAAYISLPDSTEVMGTLRLHACPYTPVNCDRHCATLSAGDRPCDTVAGITDRHLFGSVLPTGSRTPLFRSLSSVVVDHYGEHQVVFFYVNAGEEIARVEMLAWSAGLEGAVGFAHAALLAQVEKGHGYPVALSEAHEQAVITGQDRRHFQLLMEDALAGERLPTGTSEKERSKRTRYV